MFWCYRLRVVKVIFLWRDPDIILRWFPATSDIYRRNLGPLSIYILVLATEIIRLLIRRWYRINLLQIFNLVLGTISVHLNPLIILVIFIAIKSSDIILRSSWLKSFKRLSFWAGAVFFVRLWYNLNNACTFLIHINSNIIN